MRKIEIEIIEGTGSQAGMIRIETQFEANDPATATKLENNMAAAVKMNINHLFQSIPELLGSYSSDDMDTSRMKAEIDVSIMRSAGAIKEEDNGDNAEGEGGESEEGPSVISR